MSKKIYIVTGPAGIGKSTTASLLAKSLMKSAYIEGDTISHMSVAGREKPWESTAASQLVWKNIKDLTANFLDDGCDVVIDWIAFWDDARELIEYWLDQDVEVRYVVLWADEETHVNRDKARPTDIQMGERVLILRREFLESGVDDRFYLSNTTENIEITLKSIVENSNYLVTKADFAKVTMYESC